MIEPAGVMWSAAAELDLLAGVISFPDRAEVAFERLTPEHFHDPVHGRIWTAFADLKKAGQGLNPVVIGHRLGADQGFTEWGGVGGLVGLMEKGSPFGLSVRVDVLSDLYTRRSVEALAREVIARARDTGDGSGDQILATFEREAHDIAQRTSVADAWICASDMMADAIEAARTRDGVIRYPIGLPSVDKHLGGLNAGESTTIGAWTGMGKTIAGLQIAKANGAAGNGVAYFSLEMTESPMAMRLACDIAYDRSAAAYSGVTTNITINRALKGDLSVGEFETLRQSQRVASGWPVFFDVRPNLSVAQIEAATVRLHRTWARHGIQPGPVIIDHIGKIRPTVDRRGNVTAETRDIANDLDHMAKRLGVPVVILTQLNRTVENSSAKDKRPTLSSVKDSGALVENSRQVIFIYRPEYYFREPFEHESFDAKNERLAELEKVKNHFYWLIEKNSNGPQAQVRSYCQAACSAVREWDA